MFDVLMQTDIQLFHFINAIAICKPADILFAFITEPKNIWPFYGVLLLILLIKFSVRGRLAALALILTVITTDTISTQIIKPAIGRERPCRAIAETRKLVSCGPGQSLPSTHALNNATIAVLLGLLFPMLRIPLSIIALLIGYSRIYVGVHYPLDIAGGFAFGIIAGYLAFILVLKVEQYLQINNRKSV